MKKSLFFILLTLLLLITMASCRSNHPTFRAEVLAPDQHYYLRHEDALLFVYSITSVGGHESGGKYFINRNDSIVVLDAHGEPILYSDILPGAVVDITYSAVVLQTDPAIIPGATIIQVVA